MSNKKRARRFLPYETDYKLLDNYICCSTYGNPRSKGFHQKYYKDLLKSLDLPDIHFHQLRNTYATILLKIDEKKTLTLPQVLRLIEASKETPIHMQILFAVLMGLRRSEINGLKYSDVDTIIICLIFIFTS